MTDPADQTTREPRTEAGKALYRKSGTIFTHDVILAIEEQATAEADLRLLVMTTARDAAVKEADRLREAATEVQCPYCPHTVVGHDGNDCGAQDCQCENPIEAATEARRELLAKVEALPRWFESYDVHGTGSCLREHPTGEWVKRADIERLIEEGVTP